MSQLRRCSRTVCAKPAVATLTYVYRDQTAVVGPLATPPEPHSYDLCEDHAIRLSAPRGWELVRHAGDFTPAPPSPDDLEALADAVRQRASAPRVTDRVPVSRSSGDSDIDAGSAPMAGRRHLRALRTDT